MTRGHLAMAGILLASLIHAPGAAAHTHHHSLRARIHRLERHEAAESLREASMVAQLNAASAMIERLRDTLTCFEAMDVRIPDTGYPNEGQIFAAFDLPDLAAPTYQVAIYDARTLGGQNCLNPDPATSSPTISGYFHGLVVP